MMQCLIKAVYSKIEKITSFNSNYKNIIKITLSDIFASVNTDNLL